MDEKENTQFGQKKKRNSQDIEDENAEEQHIKSQRLGSLGRIIASTALAADRTESGSRLSSKIDNESLKSIRRSVLSNFFEAINIGDMMGLAFLVQRHCAESCLLTTPDLREPICGRAEIMMFFSLMCEAFPDGIYRPISGSEGIANTNSVSTCYNFIGTKVFSHTLDTLFQNVKEQWEAVHHLQDIEGGRDGRVCVISSLISSLAVPLCTYPTLVAPLAANFSTTSVDSAQKVSCNDNQKKCEFNNCDSDDVISVSATGKGADLSHMLSLAGRSGAITDQSIPKSQLQRSRSESENRINSKCDLHENWQSENMVSDDVISVSATGNTTDLSHVLSLAGRSAHIADPIGGATQDQSQCGSRSPRSKSDSSESSYIANGSFSLWSKSGVTNNSKELLMTYQSSYPKSAYGSIESVDEFCSDFRSTVPEVVNYLGSMQCVQLPLQVIGDVDISPLPKASNIVASAPRLAVSPTFIPGGTAASTIPPNRSLSQQQTVSAQYPTVLDRLSSTMGLIANSLFLSSGKSVTSKWKRKMEFAFGGVLEDQLITSITIVPV